MDTRLAHHAVDRAAAEAETSSGGIGAGDSPDTVEFVRFCRSRRHVAWPELYDEMCAVAARGAFRGWGFAELAERGIGFTLSDMPGLAAIVGRVVREERGSRPRAAADSSAAGAPAEAKGEARGDGQASSQGMGLRPAGAG